MLSQSLARAQTSFQKWKKSTSWTRSQLLLSAAAKLESRSEEFAILLCEEAKKPIRLARAEVDRAIGVLRWAAGETQRYAGELLRLDVSASGRSGFGVHTRFPRGPVLGITPFNFPLNLAIHKIAPAIASGCSILIKPSPYTPQVALRCAELFLDEPDLVQVIFADDLQTAQLTRAQEIKTISFTGSTRVGRLIRHQSPDKPTLLELGGNAWVFVLEDTPRELFAGIAKRICHAAYGYAGQSCISVQNIAVASPILSEFQEILAQTVRTIPFGDPSLESVISGPSIHLDAANKIQAGIKAVPSTYPRISSTQLELGSMSPALTECVVPPTLFIAPELEIGTLPEIIREEIFGPIMTLTELKNLDQGIALVNAGAYGLQAGVYTQAWSTIEHLYRELDVGGLIVNDVPTTRYDHQPYGGVRESGSGREGVRYAMDEMTESKFLALSSTVITA